LDFRGCFFDFIFIFCGGGSVCFLGSVLASFGSSFLFVVVWFWFGFVCSLPALKAFWNGGFKGGRRKKEKEAQSPAQQGFESKKVIVENFFI
jgi:hypothetical protein